jgi:hypothetical protein
LIELGTILGYLQLSVFPSKLVEVGFCKIRACNEGTKTTSGAGVVSWTSFKFSVQLGVSFQMLVHRQQQLGYLSKFDSKSDCLVFAMGIKQNFWNELKR